MIIKKQKEISMAKINQDLSNKQIASVLTDVLIRFGIIAAVVVLCIEVFAPFMGIMLWALILAVALYPLHLKLAKKLKGKHGRAATVIVVVGLLIIGGPTILLGKSFSEHIHQVYSQFEQGTLTIPAPKESVADIPVIGEKAYSIWSAASEDLPELVKSVQPQLRDFSKKLFAITASTAGAIFSFLGSLIVAGIMMAYGVSGSQAMLEIFQRISNPQQGKRLHSLSVGTVRSVATGVIGVAFIQALLLGIGFVFAGIPGAGVLAAVVMVFGILQLPAAIITIPAIAYLWMGGDGSTTSNIVYSIYLVIAGLADNVLKPILLGRGVDAPMPVVLLGALGGMVVAGIIGLFVGSVLLAVGYQIFMDWVKNADQYSQVDQSTEEV